MFLVIYSAGDIGEKRMTNLELQILVEKWSADVCKVGNSFRAVYQDGETLRFFDFKTAREAAVFIVSVNLAGGRAFV